MYIFTKLVVVLATTSHTITVNASGQGLNSADSATLVQGPLGNVNINGTPQQLNDHENVEGRRPVVEGQIAVVQVEDQDHQNDEKKHPVVHLDSDNSPIGQQTTSKIPSDDNGMRQHMDALNRVMWHEDQFDKFLAETEHKMRLVAFSYVSAVSRVELMNAYSNLAILVVQHLATIVDDSAKADSHMATAVTSGDPDGGSELGAGPQPQVG